MSPLWRRGLWLWAGALAAILCLVFLPFSPKTRWIAFLLVVVVCLAGVWRAGRNTHAGSAEKHLDGLPPENYRLPIVLVCGDSLPSLFGTDTIHQSAQGCWLRIDDTSTLRQYAQQLLWQRPEWAGQLSVMTSVNPQQHSDERALAARLHELRWQLAQLRHATRRNVPLLVCSTVATSLTNTPVWLSQQYQQPIAVWPAVTLPETLTNWQRNNGNVQQAVRIKQTVIFFQQNQWLDTHVLPALQQRNDDVVSVSPQQVILHQVADLAGFKSGSLWQRWLETRTSLNQVAGWHPVSESNSDILAFPDFIFSDLPAGSGVSSHRKILRYSVTFLTLASMVALCCSAWHNRQLMHHVAYDIRHYDSVEMNDYGPKAKAVEVLRQDAAQLNEWFRNGEPLRLGLGLYQGERLRLPLMTAIKSYISPPPPPPAAPAPETVRLDALSLFDTGKYQLKPDSTKLLVNALIGIKAKPGWLIVVAGHTDITGDANANQILSFRRAEALRDWMLSTSDVSPTCFAVQGYGATRPIATNDTAAGRAANRRVDISLVPQANACQAPVPQPASGSDVGITISKEK